MTTEELIKQIKKSTLRRYNIKRAEDGQKPAEKLSRQIRALIETLVHADLIK